MCRSPSAVETRCRVWIAMYEGPGPADWNGIPERAIALEPAESRTMTFRRARRYVEAFNRAAAEGRRKVWAIAVPVAVHYEGEPRPGDVL